MRIGISIASNYPLEDHRLGAAHMIDRARAANQAGLDSLFVGDHHSVPVPYYQNTPMMGRLLAEWDERSAGALYLLPLWHPVLLAEQVATLACIAKGPFILQCGLGGDEHQFRAMGASIRNRPSAFEQSLECLQALWKGDTVSLNGRWSFEEACISPLPPAPIQIWIGASAPVAIERAARLGDAWLADPGMTLSQATEAISTYKEALKQHQRSINRIAIRRDIYVAESKRDADATRELIQQKGYRGFPMEALMIGESASIAAEISAFEDVGYTDIIVRNLHRDAAKALASTYRLAEVIDQLSAS